MLIRSLPSRASSPTGVSRLLRPGSMLMALALAMLFGLPPSLAADGGTAGLGEVHRQVDSMLEDLAAIMGFGPRRPVKLESITKEAFRRLYETRMQEESSPEEMRGEVLFLRMFGLVPDDFDYEETVLDLLSEQAWALYDYKRRSMYLADWAPAEAREYGLVHELVHAIDDQEFNLRKYVKGAKQSEAQLARLAAVEGQASWVMTEWAMRQSDKSLLDSRMIAITAASATRFEAEQFPVYQSTPLYFREILIFPYTDGLLFQHEMIDRFGQDGFRKVFEQPPATTQQILQPDLYLEALDPPPPALHGGKLPRGLKRFYDGTFGQLDHKILLEHHLGADDRRELLDKWRGGRFEVLANRRREQESAVLRYAVRWEDRAAAREYYHLYRQVCERKWKGLELVDTGPNRCEGSSPRGRVVVEVDGSVVRSVEGLPD